MCYLATSQMMQTTLAYPGVLALSAIEVEAQLATVVSPIDRCPLGQTPAFCGSAKPTVTAEMFSPHTVQFKTKAHQFSLLKLTTICPGFSANSS